MRGSVQLRVELEFTLSALSLSLDSTLFRHRDAHTASPTHSKDAHDTQTQDACSIMHHAWLTHTQTHSTCTTRAHKHALRFPTRPSYAAARSIAVCTTPRGTLFLLLVERSIRLTTPRARAPTREVTHRFIEHGEEDLLRRRLQVLHRSPLDRWTTGAAHHRHTHNRSQVGSAPSFTSWQRFECGGGIGRCESVPPPPPSRVPLGLRDANEKLLLLTLLRIVSV